LSELILIDSRRISYFFTSPERAYKNNQIVQSFDETAINKLTTHGRSSCIMEQPQQKERTSTVSLRSAVEVPRTHAGSA
jgi:hypothetical protein